LIFIIFYFNHNRNFFWLVSLNIFVFIFRRLFIYKGASIRVFRWLWWLNKTNCFWIIPFFVLRILRNFWIIINKFNCRLTNNERSFWCTFLNLSFKNIKTYRLLNIILIGIRFLFIRHLITIWLCWIIKNLLFWNWCIFNILLILTPLWTVVFELHEIAIIWTAAIF
jgi:hypothetical protein